MNVQRLQVMNTSLVVNCLLLIQTPDLRNITGVLLDDRIIKVTGMEESYDILHVTIRIFEYKIYVHERSLVILRLCLFFK